MAQRPIFVPTRDDDRLVREESVSFTWYPGFALTQAQKSIGALHDAAQDYVDGLILEISTKSPDRLGVALSAFNLTFHDRNCRQLTVEAAFQGSKVFQGNAQYDDLYTKDAREAKTDPRLKTSGALEGFHFEDTDWPLEPKTAFYDWLYLRALNDNRRLAEQLLEFAAFTDIMFNPKKSFNCQARSAALYVALSRRNWVQTALSGAEQFLSLVTDAKPTQGRLFESSRER